MGWCEGDNCREQGLCQPRMYTIYNLNLASKQTNLLKSHSATERVPITQPRKSGVIGHSPILELIANLLN